MFTLEEFTANERSGVDKNGHGVPQQYVANDRIGDSEHFDPGLMRPPAPAPINAPRCVVLKLEHPMLPKEITAARVREPTVRAAFRSIMKHHPVH